MNSDRRAPRIVFLFTNEGVESGLGRVLQHQHCARTVLCNTKYVGRIVLEQGEKKTVIRGFGSSMTQLDKMKPC